MKIDIDELERKAKAATPGDWTVVDHGGVAVVASVPCDHIGNDGCLWGSHPEVVVGLNKSSAANARHIVASSPRVTLALIARIRELEKSTARLTTELDHVAPAGERDHLSRASRRMVETVMGDRDTLREKLRDLTSTLHAEFETSDPAEIIATMRMVIGERDQMQTERDVWRARAQIAELEIEAMRPVVAAAEAWQLADAECQSTGRTVGGIQRTEQALADLVAAYRATADTRDAAIARLASEAPTT